MLHSSPPFPLRFLTHQLRASGKAIAQSNYISRPIHICLRRDVGGDSEDSRRVSVSTERMLMGVPCCTRAGSAGVSSGLGRVTVTESGSDNAKNDFDEETASREAVNVVEIEKTRRKGTRRKLREDHTRDGRGGCGDASPLAHSQTETFKYILSRRLSAYSRDAKVIQRS
jgi:hypothetical protein